MTVQAEYDALSAQYAAWIAAGCPDSYTTSGGRSVTRHNMMEIRKRMDTLEIVLSRQASTGGCPVGQFRSVD